MKMFNENLGSCKILKTALRSQFTLTLQLIYFIDRIKSYVPIVESVQVDLVWTIRILINK